MIPAGRPARHGRPRRQGRPGHGSRAIYALRGKAVAVIEQAARPRGNEDRGRPTRGLERAARFGALERSRSLQATMLGGLRLGRGLEENARGHADAARRPPRRRDLYQPTASNSHFNGTGGIPPARQALQVDDANQPPGFSAQPNSTTARGVLDLMCLWTGRRQSMVLAGSLGSSGPDADVLASPARPRGAGRM